MVDLVVRRVLIVDPQIREFKSPRTTDEVRFLLLQRSLDAKHKPGLWEAPGTCVLGHEPRVATLNRAVHKETRLRLLPGVQFVEEFQRTLQSDGAQYAEKYFTGYRSTYYIGEVVSLSGIVLDVEHVACKFFTAAEVNEFHTEVRRSTVSAIRVATMAVLPKLVAKEFRRRQYYAGRQGTASW
jgi:hypothetical protein